MPARRCTTRSGERTTALSDECFIAPINRFTGELRASPHNQFPHSHWLPSTNGRAAGSPPASHWSTRLIILPTFARNYCRKGTNVTFQLIVVLITWKQNFLRRTQPSLQTMRGRAHCWLRTEQPRQLFNYYSQ